MSVTVTVTFATAAEAAAFLAGNASKKPAAEPPKAADTPRTAEAAAPKADAQSTKELDFDKDVLPAMKAYAAKVSRDDFAALLKKHGVAKVPELKAKPDTWADIVDTCKG